jgi:hypothetical protein
MNATDLSWPSDTFDPLLERIFLRLRQDDMRPSAADVDEFLSLGFELCQMLMVDFFKRTVGTPAEADLNSWALFGPELHYALPDGKRELCLALCFQAFSAYTQHTSWHAWDGQCTVFNGDEDLGYRKAFFRHFCIDAVTQGTLYYYQNWFGDAEQQFAVLATELSAPLRLLVLKCLSERDDEEPMIWSLAEQLDIPEVEVRARLEQVLRTGQAG